MKNFMQLAGGVDVLPLLLAIQRRPELWQEDDFLRNYPQGPFGEVETIFLRFPKRLVGISDEDVERYKKNMLPGWDQHESIDYPAYATLHEARPLVMNLMARVQGERLGRVMINKINPGGRIYPHADTPEHANYYSRFHVVLQSAPGSDFRCENEHVNMKQGEVWWFNNKLEHEVVNNSAVARIHMIVDIRTSQ